MARFPSNVHWAARHAAELAECSMPFYYAWKCDCSFVSRLAVRKQAMVANAFAELRRFYSILLPLDVICPPPAAGGIGR
jgi:hypothetical protein